MENNEKKKPLQLNREMDAPHPAATGGDGTRLLQAGHRLDERHGRIERRWE